VQAVQHLAGDRHCARRRERAVVERAAQVAAFDIFHDDEVDAVGRADVEDLYDVLVRDATRGARFTAKPRDRRNLIATTLSSPT
jgi:hypothetical protein